MASFLTALASVGSQYAEGKEAARAEKAATAEKQQRLGIDQSYLDLARQAGRRQQEELELRKKSGDIIELKDGRLWSVSQGKIIDVPKAPAAATTIGQFISKQPKAIQGQLTEAAQMYAENDPNRPEHALDKILSIAEDYRKKQETLHKTDPIIAAQVGPYPDPARYPQGEDDPQYRVATKKWGIEAETVKNRIASAAAEARGKAYGEFRPGAFIDQQGNIQSGFWGDAIRRGLIPYQPGFQSLTRTQQIVEMQGASSKLRSAIDALQPEDAFSPTAVIQLRAAAGAGDESAFREVINNALAGTLNERQMNYLLWLQQMGERVLSLRNVAGMGQGAQDLRAAIQATLPGITSGSKQFALKRLDAVDNQINILGRGIPRTNINMGGPGAAPSAAPMPKLSISPDGTISIK